jgi:hypothetical protein
MLFDETERVEAVILHKFVQRSLNIPTELASCCDSRVFTLMRAAMRFLSLTDTKSLLFIRITSANAICSTLWGQQKTYRQVYGSSHQA